MNVHRRVAPALAAIAALTWSPAALAQSTAGSAEPSTANALVTISTASLRATPSHAAELETQALGGTPAALGERRGDFISATLPNGYRAWVPVSSVKRKSSAEMKAWRGADRRIVTTPCPIYLTSDTLSAGPHNMVSDLVAGCIVEVPAVATATAAGRYIYVSLPDGRAGYVSADAVAPLDAFLSRKPSAEAIMEFARSLTGTPYLWGGNSTKAVDCSGLTSLAYMMGAGVQLPRNASQQARIGVAVDKNDISKFQAGDLIFFTNSRSGKVNHVGLATGDGRIIHASGRVRNDSLDPKAADYIGRPIHSVRRVLGTADAVRLIDSPLYFNR
ncbi:MAG: C40 family peptidase [Candidatus Amulumruptor caecigallinarius]|nr:C40 family peptidase [Candidatus Amulumruptor caecigallinarius]MCM1397199.1 C40 family peptidase [Candidatus Amulumruptor caecigallinarius]MCM1453112.1 C40 family peptidase [bacterium]